MEADGMKHEKKHSANNLNEIIRRAIWVIGVIIIIVVLLGGGGLAYQSVSADRDNQQYSPPGRMVDVGGYQLYLYCTGKGSPTVILESGLGGPALQWELVQQRLDKTTQVCSYDRAGLGWSDDGPGPRTSQQMANELHSLLHNAGVGGPYVLVGHSLGGLNVRLFAHDYPNETAGIVLVASGSENDLARMPPEYAKIEESNKQSDRLFITLTRFGITRIAGNMGLLYLQVELANLSSNSVHIVCDTCDHYMPMTNPDIVVDAINQELSNILR
jgi:hypothetical protein